METADGRGQRQRGLINVTGFSVKGEAALERAARRRNRSAWQNGVSFTALRAEFTPAERTTHDPGRCRQGPTIGATIEGNIDYVGNTVRMSGTFVPMYGLNNMFGQIPVLGLIIGAAAMRA